MKTIRTLNALINILFYILVVFIVSITIFYIIILFFGDHLPLLFQGYRMIFSFGWKLLIVPVFTYINFILFIMGIYYMKKTIPSFKKHDFYSESMIKNLKKAGKLFVFIGSSMIFFKLLGLLVFQNTIGLGKGWTLLFSILGSIDLPMISLIIIGLFLLLFSDSFKNGKALQEENKLTI